MNMLPLLKVSGDEQLRLERLQQVTGFIKSRLPQSFKDIQSLEDDKGSLIVTWREEPSHFARGIALQAWEAIGEYGGQVRHAVEPQSPPASASQVIDDASAEVVAQVAYEIVKQVMSEGQPKHGSSWRMRSDSEDLMHARRHFELLLTGDASELHLEHTLTRLVLVLARRKEANSKKGVTE